MNQIDPKQIREDIAYFMGKINFGASHLDARAVQIMNELFGIPALIEELEELTCLNNQYRSLQDITSFVMLDAWPDRPWTDLEVEIVDRHNARIAKYFTIPKPNTQEAIDKFASMAVPEPYQIREAREALIESIKDFSALYEDEGESFDEIKMEVAVMQMLTEHFNSFKDTNRTLIEVSNAEA